MIDVAAYAGLFGAAFAAATILPAQSEAVLVGLLLSDSYSPVLVLAVGVHPVRPDTRLGLLSAGR
jgi:membrane protein YqaA with SNARE-associated domain